ncbi:hypothetical protein F0562_036221 [Nyssa sinensis]|uniref:Uncharacterized protein n=1 Tax=Nyssa sinensis TaxID=561372 RepID=A0A5J5AGJ5_9ASTE|nr:hypothetical protein F0562_036221 [Nyssa sinensis]
MEPKSKPCLFLGYSQTQSAYKCLEPQTKKIYISRHVVFDENQPHPLSAPSASASPIASSLTLFDYQITSRPAPSHRPPALPLSSAPSSPEGVLAPVAPSSGNITNPQVSIAPPAVLGYVFPNPHTLVSNSPAHDTFAAPPTVDPSFSHESSTEQTLGPTTHTQSSIEGNQHETSVPSQRVHRMTTQSMNKIFKPKQLHTVSLHPLPPTIESTCVSHALSQPEWCEAMSHELTALMKHGTWDLVPPPLNCNLVGCKWVFRVKRKPDGSVDRFKAHLVAKGYNQRPRLDYKETFNPAVKPATIRAVISIAVMKGWQIRQLDVNIAFLNRELTETIFMVQPPGFKDPFQPHHVCQLRKAIYGLKQAPRAWYTALKTTILQLGFHNSQADPSLFIYTKGSILCYFLVYVDDLLLTGNDSSFVASIIQQLGLFLSQHKYVRDLLSTTSMSGAKDVSTPLSTSQSLHLFDGTPPINSSKFCRVIDRLQYLSLTHPDISFTVNKLSQFMHKPTTTHSTTTKRLLRYLKQTIFHGIQITKAGSLVSTTYSDSDWAGNVDDRTSTSAYITFLGSNPISWSSKKQRAIARSTTEAEYRSLANIASETMWLLGLFNELGFSLKQSPHLLCDNLGATHLSFNLVHHSRMKHIQIDLHFVRDLVQEGRIHV